MERHGILSRCLLPGARVAAAPLLEGHQMQLCPVGLEDDSELLCVGNNCTAGGKFCYTDRMCVVRLDSEPCFSGTQNRKYRLPDRRGLEIENGPPNAIFARAGAVFRVHRFYRAAPTAADPESGAPPRMPCEVLKARGFTV